MQSREVVRVGIVGMGFIGEIHAAGYALNPRARLEGVVDVRLDKARGLAEKYGTRAYSSLDELLAAEKLDAVDICLPSTYHREAVIKAANAGLHVVVEKPFALDLRDIDEMIDAAGANGVRLMVAHVCRFMPEYLVARSFVENGQLGRPLFFSAWRNSTTPGWSWQNWLLDRQLSGGTVMDLQIHDIDLSNWLLGVPSSFQMREVMLPGRPGPSHVISSLVYNGGALANLEASHLMPAAYPFSIGYRLLFERGAVEYHSPQGGEKKVMVYAPEGVTALAGSQLPRITGDDPYAEELAHFVDCLLSGTEFRVSLREARLAVASVLRLRESLAQGGRVSELKVC